MRPCACSICVSLFSISNNIKEATWEKGATESKMIWLPQKRVQNNSKKKDSKTGIIKLWYGLYQVSFDHVDAWVADRVGGIIHFLRGAI